MAKLAAEAGALTAHAAPLSPAITIALFSNFFMFRLLRFQRLQPLSMPEPCGRRTRLKNAQGGLLSQLF
jgi:hypothetical protein